MKKYLILLLCLFFMTGCSSAKDQVESNTSGKTTDSDSLDSSFYKIVNQGDTANRNSLYSSFGSTDDFVKIGRNLQIISTDHFSTDDCYMSEGVQLKKADYDQLLKRDADKNKYPHSLQPAKGTTIENVVDPIMVSSLYEQDYYEKDGSEYVLKGMSIAIVINPRDSSDNALTTPMSDNTIKDYGRGCIEKLYNYLQTKKKLKDIPYNICIYQATDSTKNDYNGHYIYSSYCQGSVGNINSVDEETYLFTSDEATKNDEDTASNFAVFKNNLKKEATEAVGVIGYGKYRDGAIQSMKIQMTVNIKTYTELVYLVSFAADQLDSQFSGFDIRVVVNSQDGLEALIVKDKDSNAQSYLLDS